VDGRLATENDPSKEIAEAQLAIHESVRLTGLMFYTAGTNAIYRANSLEWQFRDRHVAAHDARQDGNAPAPPGVNLALLPQPGNKRDERKFNRRLKTRTCVLSR
jgi:hypothetical protein